MDNLKLRITDPQKHFSTPVTNDRFSSEQKTKLAKVTKEFESMLNSMMLKSMTEGNGGLMGSEGYGADQFGSLFEGELASFMTKSKSLGIAETMYKKITGEDFPSATSSKRITPGKNLTVLSPSSKTTVAIAPPTNAIDRLSKYDKIVEDASKMYGVDKNIIKSIIMTESAANERAVSSCSAKGLMQLIDPTAEAMGVKNSFDPRQNIFGGTKYISQMIKRYNGNLDLALAAYNAGPGNVDKFNGIPPFQETQNYVVRVSGYIKFFNAAKQGEDFSSSKLASADPVVPKLNSESGIGIAQ